MDKKVFSERKKLLCTVTRLLEGPMVFLGFVWLVLLIIEFIWGLTPMLQLLSVAIWIIFILDFLLKFMLAPAKLRFLKVNWLTAISLILPALRVFRLVRILRVLRGTRLIKVVASLNRSMKSLSATMGRRGFSYVLVLTILVTFGGAAGMYAIEKGHSGFENYGMALWWTAMRVITAGSDFWPVTPEGRALAFVLSLFGYGIFGYVTAMLATFFIGRDAEDDQTAVAGTKDIAELKKMIAALTKEVQTLQKKTED